MKQPNRRSKITIGLDLGDRRHRLCVLNEEGEVVEEASIVNERTGLAELAGRYPGAVVVMEAGCHSPWISRYLEGLRCRVLVSNPRKVRAIYQHERKSDQRDALMLARIARMEPALLYPVRHGSEEAQQDLLRIKLRDSLVRARVALINSVRFTLKSLGYSVPNPASERFHKVVMEELPEALSQMIAPSVAALAELSARIKVLEREITQMARVKYPQSAWLQQVPGVGPITALYFVLKIEDPARFERVRDIGAFAGLCPRRDQSGESDPQLRISKRGDAYLRRLLVSAAQYIIGPFGPQSALRQYGLSLAAEGTARAKKRAVVAVARKLAVLLLTLWKKQSPYQPFPLTIA
ncbi:MAG TPA: IS110 family transposase [Candidatus Limnocylindrales bacterium]|nr:IS110 family transposase [Candidatus Limnocylindrales bacterium]